MEISPFASVVGTSEPEKPTDTPNSVKTKATKKGKDAIHTENMKKDIARNFVWEDDEVELLLSCTAEYKTKKAMEGTDWESVRGKYEEILQIYKENIPSVEDCEKMGKCFKHRGDITKDTVLTKLKAIRLKYREAVDDGRRSGHGRVVLLYYELCAQIWGGSPATEQLSVGIESVDVDCFEDSKSTIESPSCSKLPTPSILQAQASERDRISPEVTTATVQKRRDLLDSKLDNYRHERLKRKASFDQQLLSIAQEDASLKRKLLEHMAKGEEEHRKTMASLTENMNKMANSINAGFSLLQTLLAPNMPLSDVQRGLHSPMQPSYVYQTPSSFPGHVIRPFTSQPTASNSSQPSVPPTSSFLDYNRESP